MSNKLLSKSDYMLFLAHPAWLWLKKNKPDVLPPIDDNTQAIFDAGHEFEAYAETLFPNRIRLGFKDYHQYLALSQKTKRALKIKVPAIFQGRLEAGSLTCIVDVLERIDNNTFNLIEIKSSTKVKQEHLFDLAFQLTVALKAGLKIKNIEVIHINKAYVRQGDIDPKQLCHRVDVTEEVKALLPDTQKNLVRAYAVLKSELMPDPSPRYADAGALKDWLPIYKSLNPHLSSYSIYSLASADPLLLGQLEDMHIEKIKDIPSDFKLKPRQKFQHQTITSNASIIKHQQIKDFLNQLTYPLYYFDYETMGSPIPPFDGLIPFAQVPFQYSLHIQQSPGAPLTHVEYLHQKSTNPATEITQHLKAHMGETGTILVWYASFEKKINQIMGKYLPESQAFYQALNDRIIDLMLPFSNGWFVDKDFFGSASLKKVQPVLVPDLAYDQLSVAEGQHAQRIWTETFLEGKHPTQKDTIIKDLLTYCGYDTLVMVKIVEFLVSLTHNS